MIFTGPRYKEAPAQEDSQHHARAHSPGVLHPELCCYVARGLCLFASLSGRHGSVSHCLHRMFSPWYMLQLLTCRASKRNKTNLQTAEFGQSQRQQSLSWTLLKAGQEDRGLQKCLLFEAKAEAKTVVQKFLCMEVLWSQSAQRQLAKADWLLAAMPQRTEETTCLASAFECL